MPYHTQHELIHLSDEVAEALDAGRPVVAMESSFISHGPPYPTNVEMAAAVDQAVRDTGGAPARIAIADGRFLVGMTPEQADQLATTPGTPKVSTRDIGTVLASGGMGAATVSAGLVAAELVGIQVFAVAGIGGVHRNAQQTFDISADLVQFSRSRLAVVCAGAKSLLDPALTLEYLETLGVPVVGYRCDDFPAYLSRSSGQPNPHRIDELSQIAAAINHHWRLDGVGGFLVTHPIAEADEIPAEELERPLREALGKADSSGVAGPGVTPHVMASVSAATKGRSTAANRSVLVSTTRLAGELAAELASARVELATGRAEPAAVAQGASR